MSARKLIAVFALIVLAAACGGADSDSEDTMTVVATTTILGDVVANVVGDEAEVVVLMRIGADPHDFQASSSQVAEINKADLVVANGLLLEEGLSDVLAAAASDGVRVLEVAPLLDPIPFAITAHHDEDHGDEHDEEGSADPHVWLDPIRMGQAARLIAAELSVIESGGDWSARADTYADELADLDRAIGELLTTVATKRIVTNHLSLGYFADRYGFEIVGVVIPGGSTLADPSSDKMSDLVAAMRAEGVSVIFGETTQPNALAETVAAELGEDVAVIQLYTGSLDEPGTQASTLIGMLRTNAELIAGALGS